MGEAARRRSATLTVLLFVLTAAAGAVRADDTPEKPSAKMEKRVEKRKVTICHRPPGNPANAHTISVGEPATAAHLKHGDYLGACAAGDPKPGDGKR